MLLANFFPIFKKSYSVHLQILFLLISFPLQIRNSAGVECSFLLPLVIVFNIFHICLILFLCLLKKLHSNLFCNTSILL